MKNILMLCYYFPPLTDVGCKRSIAFSKYLKKHGWNPYVLSVKNPDKEYCSLGDEVPPAGVHTEYAYSLFNLYWLINNADAALRKILSFLGMSYRTNHIYNLFCIPDHFIGWLPMAFLKGRGMIKAHDVDCIYVSCTPHSAAFVGVWLKKMTGKPLVIDYRDPFHIEDCSTTGYRKRLNKRLQRYFISKADTVIVNNEDVKSAYLDEYPEVVNKIHVIHNGFDAEHLPPQSESKYDKFTITYTGDFYFERIPAELIFEAIQLLVNNGKINSDNFQFLFYGDGTHQIKSLSVKYGVQDLVTANTRIPYHDVLKVLSQSHMQLLRILKPMISTKLFEGIPLNVPFLATIPDGEVEKIINQYSPSSAIVTSQSPVDVADAILQVKDCYENGSIENNDVQGFLADYSRENLTHKLMSVIEANSVKA